MGVFNAVCYGWTNSAPQAKCGPTQRFQWPAEAFRKIFKSESYTIASTLIRRHDLPLNAAVSKWPLSSKDNCPIPAVCSSTASRFRHQLQVAYQRRRYVCMGVYVIARCTRRRKTYFAEYSQQSRSFYSSR